MSNKKKMRTKVMLVFENKGQQENLNLRKIVYGGRQMNLTKDIVMEVKLVDRYFIKVKAIT